MFCYFRFLNNVDSLSILTNEMHKAASMRLYNKEEFVKVMHFNVLCVYVTIFMYVVILRI